MKAFENFSELNLPPVLVEVLARMDFKSPTPIQQVGIPAALMGKDILGIAPTGTGKTGAYGIPAMAALYPQPGKQVLVLAPTRELAAQIFKFMRQIGEGLKLTGTLLVGGESFGRQRAECRKGVDFMVATPGRLNDHLAQGLRLTRVSMLVLDEVDRMLDMGFAPQVEQIVMYMPRQRQTFLFSATLPREIQDLANRYLKEPVRLTVGQGPSQAPKIKEEQLQTNSVEKPRLLIDQVNARQGKILVFVNTQGHAEQVARNLENAGHPAACLHGGRTHSERKRALEAFRQGIVRILVATDIAARGIDVPDIEHVFNFDRPATQEDYLHRIGRTGRIGKTGCAVNFIDERSRKFRSGPRGPRPMAPRQQGPRPFRKEREANLAGARPFVKDRDTSSPGPRPFDKSRDARSAGPRYFGKDRDANSSGPRSFRNDRDARPAGPRYFGKDRDAGASASPRPFRKDRDASSAPGPHSFRKDRDAGSAPQSDRFPEKRTAGKKRTNGFIREKKRAESAVFAPSLSGPKPSSKKPFVRGSGSSIRRPKSPSLHQ